MTPDDEDKARKDIDILRKADDIQRDDERFNRILAYCQEKNERLYPREQTNDPTRLGYRRING